MKEIPCPHCGQDLLIPADVNNDEVERLRKIEQAARDVNDWLIRNNLKGMAHQRLLDEVLKVNK